MNKNFIIQENCTKLTEVLVTKNYGLFGHIPGNREINSGNLSNIKDSSQKKQILESAIIVGYDPNDYKFKIIEGQHRFEAWKVLKLPISFIVREDFDINDYDKSIADVQLLNTANKEWDVTNFMGSRAALGEISYVHYKEIFDKYQEQTEIGFEHEILFYILNQMPNRKIIKHKEFKEGKLELNEIEKNKLDFILSELSKYLNKVKNFGKRYYLKSIIDILNTQNIDKEKFKAKMDKQTDFPFTKNKDLALKYLVEKVYNENLRQNKLWISTAGSETQLFVK